MTILVENLIIILSKLIKFVSNTFNLGSGYTWPGHVALTLCPNFLKSDRVRFKKGLVLVSGTNGKTTTTKLITHLFEKADYTVTSNKSGANLLNGIASSIILDFMLFRDLDCDFGVFEVDEGALPIILSNLRADVVVLLNLSRDQLDRYGEIDIILEKWKSALLNLSPVPALIVDKDKTYFNDISKIFKGDIIAFGDSINYLPKTKLRGSFNASNVNAAVSVVKFFGLKEEDFISNLGSFEFAYGRGEVVIHCEKEFKVLLAKNPASFEHNLDLIISEKNTESSLFFVLNDKIPDGRDVSWIYDIPPEKLREACENKVVYISGTRCLDMAIRLSYAGIVISGKDIFEDLWLAVKQISKNINFEKVICLPNYSSMLELRKILTGKKIL